MKCFAHASVDAVGTCANCGAAGCRECLEHYHGVMQCPVCSTNRYHESVSAIDAMQRKAHSKLRNLGLIAGFFFIVTFLFWAAFQGIGTGIAMGLFSAYSWGTFYIAAPPFVRFFGQHITGGAASTSATGAIFGMVTFWITLGWWLLLLGALYGLLGGGFFHLYRLLTAKNRLDAERSSIRPPRAASMVPAAATR